MGRYDQERKRSISESFPERYERASLGFEITSDEFHLFEQGIYSRSMDEKWNIFALSDVIYFVRSWTDRCIYKVYARRRGESVLLTEFDVNRDEEQYKGKDIEFDKSLLEQMLQLYLNREDRNIDPRLEIPLITATIERLDPDGKCKKSVGWNLVGVVKRTHDHLMTAEQQKYCEVHGWIELKAKLSDMPDDDSLITLDMKKTNEVDCTTYYFTKDGSQLLGSTTLDMRKAREFAAARRKERFPDGSETTEG